MGRNRRIDTIQHQPQTLISHLCANLSSLSPKSEKTSKVQVFPPNTFPSKAGVEATTDLEELKPPYLNLDQLIQKGLHVFEITPTGIAITGNFAQSNWDALASRLSSQEHVPLEN